MSQYNEDYYERGIDAGVSCYTNYRWMPKETLSMAQSIVEFADITKNDKILDFGCAKGFMVKALTMLNYECYGYDISSYALQEAEEIVKDRLFLGDNNYELDSYDTILAKDVLEHIDYATLPSLLTKFAKKCRSLFVVVPLGDGKVYNVPDYELDITHVIRENKEWWAKTFSEAGFEVIKSEYLAPGIKDQWAHYAKGNGFFLVQSKQPPLEESQ